MARHFLTGEELTSDELGRLLARALHEHVRELAKNGGALGQVGAAEQDPGLFADQVAAALGLPTDKELRVLEALPYQLYAAKVVEEPS